MGIYLGNIGGRDIMINKIKALLLIKDKGFVPCIADEWQRVALELEDAQKLSKELEMRITLLRDQLISLSENKNTCGKDFYFQKIERPGTIDYKSIPELKNVNTELYRKKGSSYWKLERY